MMSAPFPGRQSPCTLSSALALMIAFEIEQEPSFGSMAPFEAVTRNGLSENNGRGRPDYDAYRCKPKPSV